MTPTTPEPQERLQALFNALIVAMHASNTQPDPRLIAADRAREQEARNAYTAGLREVIG